MNTFLAGYRARWNGADYDAAPDPRPDGLWVRLYAQMAGPGFTEILREAGPSRYVRPVLSGECTAISFVTTVCRWQGAPFQIIGQEGDQLVLEYTGGRADIAERLGLDRIERGVYRCTIPQAAAEAVHEEVTAIEPW